MTALLIGILLIAVSILAFLAHDRKGDINKLEKEIKLYKAESLDRITSHAKEIDKLEDDMRYKSKTIKLLRTHHNDMLKTQGR